MMQINPTRFLELFSRTHVRLLAGATLAVAGLGLAIAMIDSGNDASQQARLLIEQLDWNEKDISAREYSVWKQCPVLALRYE